VAGHPSKTCESCGRTIEWRKKWERDWDQVRYCSAACRRRKVSDVDVSLETALRQALTRRGATIDPAQVAREIGGDDAAEPARRAARRLVATGDYEIMVDGRVSDPSTAKGKILLRRR
jgi:hypothetical protein